MTSTPPPRRPTDRINWPVLRRAYLSGESAAAVAARHQVSVSTVRRRARAEGWRRCDGLAPDPFVVDADAPSARQAAVAALTHACAAAAEGRVSTAEGLVRLAERLIKTSEALREPGSHEPEETEVDLAALRAALAQRAHGRGASREPASSHDETPQTPDAHRSDGRPPGGDPS